MVRLVQIDPALRPFEQDLELRMDNYRKTRDALTEGGSLSDFANAHSYLCP